MPRGKTTFRQQDLTRALRAATAAGIVVARVEIDPNGRIVIEASKADGASASDRLDQELREFERRHGTG